jgi:PTS system galactitol-specific IIA component
MPDPLSFVPELCRLDPAVTTRRDLLNYLAETADAAGHVRASFREALLAREARYPTGLPTPTPCAIPHVEAEHVAVAGLAAVRLATPVPFGEMGAPDRLVPARLVVLLLVTEPAQQVPTLGRLISLLRREDLDSRLSTAASDKGLAAVLNHLWWDAEPASA